MRQIRCLGLVAVFSLLLCTAEPADAQSIGITNYSFGRAGFSSFGFNPYSFGTVGFSPYSFGSVQASGVAPFGFGPVGTATYSLSPASSYGFHSRKQLYTSPTVVLPIGPGTLPPANGGGGGGDVTNDIKQIKERLQSLENDVKAIKDRLPPVKILVDKDLADQETQRKLKELRDKYDKYIKDNEEYNKKLGEIEVKMAAAAKAMENATTPAERNKALEDLKAAKKDYDALKPPPHPTKN